MHADVGTDAGIGVNIVCAPVSSHDSRRHCPSGGGAVASCRKVNG